MNDTEFQENWNTLTEEDRENILHYARAQSERAYSEYRTRMNMELCPTLQERQHITELVLAFCYSTEHKMMFENIQGLAEKAIEFLDFADEYIVKWGYRFTALDREEMLKRVRISRLALYSYYDGN